MTKNNAALANDTGLPELLNHIGEMQNIACKMLAMLETVVHLDIDGTCRDGRLVLVEMAAKAASDLNNGLDSVNLPEVAR